MSNNYMQIIQNLTPPEICEHYNKIVAEKDKEIEKLQAEVTKLKQVLDCYRGDYKFADGKKEV